MMYKCKNCGQIYYEQTDYCDCGNNVFITVISDDTENVLNNVEGSEEVGNVLDNLYSPPYSDNFDYHQDYVNNNYINVAEDNGNSMKTLFVVSLIVFIFSFICSFLLIIRAVNKPSKSKVSVAAPVKIDEQIPDIDTFWVTKTYNSKTNNSEQNILPTEKTNSSIDIKQKNKDIITNSVIIPKKSETISKTETKSTAKKTDNKNSSLKTQNIKSENSKKETNNNIEKNQEEKAVKQTISSNVQNTDNEKYKETDDIKQKNTNSAKELSAYKNSLRQRLFAYFPILTVSGSGSAKIGFSIDKNGKLVNRRFIVQSDNKSLNDAMYHMLMQVPAFNPPPDSYSGTEIIMKMDYNNGHYSFSFE